MRFCRRPYHTLWLCRSKPVTLRLSVQPPVPHRTSATWLASLLGGGLGFGRARIPRPLGIERWVGSRGRSHGASRGRRPWRGRPRGRGRPTGLDIRQPLGHRWRGHHRASGSLVRRGFHDCDARDSQADQFRILLGHALNDGEALVDEGAPKATIREWGQQAQDLIEAGLGPPEARLFLSDYDIDATFAMASNLPGHVWLERRLRRLTRLMDSMQGVQVGPGAKLPKPWKYRSSKRVPDAKYASERDESGDS